MEAVMFESGPVVVPLDGSDLSERALPYASAFARAFKSRLILLAAVYIPAIIGDEALTPDPRAVLEGYLGDTCKALKYEHCHTLVKIGYPYESILQALDETGASLSVISTHGQSGLSRWTTGSTAGHLLHASRVPTLVIGKDVAAVAKGGFSPKRILVPLDGSPLAEAALPAAVEIAKAFGSTISLVTVAPWSTAVLPFAAGSSTEWPDLDPQLEAAAEGYLSKVRKMLDASTKVDLNVLRGSTADALLEFVEEKPIDLVVMTTHARAGIARALFGSTADRMLHGRAPVLFIRPKDA
jgi:nucleotide-binding universal stress UspA family protein